MHLESMECGIGEIKLHHRKRGSCLIFTNEKDLCSDVKSWCGYYLSFATTTKNIVHRYMILIDLLLQNSK